MEMSHLFSRTKKKKKIPFFPDYRSAHCFKKVCICECIHTQREMYNTEIKCPKFCLLEITVCSSLLCSLGFSPYTYASTPRHIYYSLWLTIGVGNGNPLQYSCLENSMDRGAWWAAVHGITKSWT